MSRLIHTNDIAAAPAVDRARLPLRKRRPLPVFLLTLVFWPYWWFWYYRLSREVRESLRAAGSSRLGLPAWASLLMVTVGSPLLLAPLIALGLTALHVRALQGRSGVVARCRSLVVVAVSLTGGFLLLVATALEPGLARLVVFLAAVAISFAFIPYLQHHTNLIAVDQDRWIDRARAGKLGALIAGVVAALGALVMLPMLVLAGSGHFSAYKMPSISMAPTLSCNDRFISVGYLLGDPQRSDILVFTMSSNGLGELTPRAGAPIKFIKRVVGLPGERIEVTGGRVSIDGVHLVENYAVGIPDESSRANFTIPADSYFVLGDNRANSFDSREFGVVPRDAIIGHAVWAYWPPSNFGAVSDTRGDNPSFDPNLDCGALSK